MLDPKEKRRLMVERLKAKKQAADARRGISPSSQDTGQTNETNEKTTIAKTAADYSQTKRPKKGRTDTVGQKGNGEPKELPTKHTEALRSPGAPNKRNTRLTERQVMAIFNDRKSSLQSMSEQYGVTIAQISRIKSGDRFSVVTENATVYFREDHVKKKSGNYKLTPQQAKDVLESGADDETMAKQYGVHVRTIKRIRKGLTYRNKITR